MLDRNRFRRLSAALRLLPVLCLLLLTAACAQSAASGADGEAPAATPAQSTQSAAAAADGTPIPTAQPGPTPVIGDDGKYVSVQAYVESDIMQTQLETLRNAQDPQILQISLSAEGDMLVYTFRYRELAPEDREELVRSLTGILASETTTRSFTGIAQALANAVNVDDPAVAVRYLDPQGEELAAREYRYS